MFSGDDVLLFFRSSKPKGLLQLEMVRWAVHPSLFA
jgi:hypothetical protein